MRNYLIEIREQRNETQQDVANAIGISRQYYAMIENESRQKRMDITLITSLAKHFNIPVSKLISLEQSQHTNEHVQ